MENTNLNTTAATQLLRNSLDKFLAKDMKGWTDLFTIGYKLGYTKCLIPSLAS